MLNMNAPHDLSLFTDLSDAERNNILAQGEELTLQQGDRLFAEGEPAHHFYILLEGALQITRLFNGQETFVTTHDLPGSFTGEVPLLTGTPYIVSAYALSPTRVVRINAATFQQLLVSCTPITRAVLPTLAERVRTMGVVTMQQEKLAALGKLSAGLAHELNNPASAAHNAAAQLREAFLAQQNLLQSLADHPQSLSSLARFQLDAFQHASTAQPLDTLTESDRIDELTTWFEDRQIPKSWELAPTFVSSGLDRAWFHTLLTSTSPQALPDIVPALASSLQVFNLARSIEQSTNRIFTLVTAIKAYSYMDRAPLQEIDIHEGLESTLTILHHKLKHLTVVREYDRTLPHISAYAGELNQVWTNLLDNAIDALEESGSTIWVRTWRENNRVVVEIADDGPTIPPEVQTHIFEPFYTTKPLGKGTGLGLDIAYRIIVQHHHGDISLFSTPGDTRFQVRLPIHT